MATQGLTAMRCRSLGMLACTVIAPLLAVFCASSGEVGKQAPCGTSGSSPDSFKVAANCPPMVSPDLQGIQPGDLLRGRKLAPSSPAPIRATVYETEAPARAATVHGRLVPVSGTEGIGGTGGNLGPNPEPQPPSTDHFTTIQQRLRRLGATYYRLETWGERGDQFRFQCRVAFGGDSGPIRDFEAVDREAVQAMAKVLWQAQTWQTPARQN